MFRYVFSHFLTFNQRVVGSNPAGLTIFQQIDLFLICAAFERGLKFPFAINYLRK